MALGIRDIRLGRLKLVSAHDDVSESIAAQLEAVGATALPGERQPRGMNISFPLYGADGDTDPYAQAARHRRQLRALLANRDAVMQGLYFAWVADPELNGWLVVGGGDIAYEEGGVTLGDFKASLDSIYKVGALRSHRAGRRLELYDRRLSTTPRDYCGTIYSTDFAAQSALALNFLPLAVSDVLGTGRSVLAPLNRAIRDGNLQYLVGRPHGEGVTFEQAEASQTKGDVVVFDRKGITAPVETLAGSSDPQGTYGWEEVYGPDQPLTAGDVPVLENGFVRVRYVAAQVAFAIDQWVAGTGWVERGRVTNWVQWADLVVRQVTTLVSASVAEWTPEFAVLRAVYKLGDTRIEAYISLGRGWTGPRFETYGTWEVPGSKPGVAIRYTANSTDVVGFRTGSGAYLDINDAWSNPADWGMFTGEPWAAINVPNSPLVTMAVLQAACRSLTITDTAAYGAQRPAHYVSSKFGEAAAGYCSVTFGIGAAGLVAEAETYRFASGTTSQVADGVASGGQAVEDTRVAESITDPTLNNIQAPNPGRVAKVGVFVRARAVNGGATASISVRRSYDNGLSSLSPVTTTSTTYVWLYLGELTHLQVGDWINGYGWRSAGTGNVRIDKFVIVPLERRQTGAELYDGARDIAQANLYDARSVPILVAR